MNFCAGSNGGGNIRAMGTFSLFQVGEQACQRLAHQPFGLERELQRLIEKHMEGMLGARFVKTEHVIPGGRIDTLGLDENQSPVIIEYKRGMNESVLSQALFYLDWLVNHKGDFTVLVQEALGIEAARSIDWKKPRLICIAEGYTVYDRYAVNQVGREIQLIQYSKLPNDLLLLELLNDAANPFGKGTPSQMDNQESGISTSQTDIAIITNEKTNLDDLKISDETVKSLFLDLDSSISSLGSDVERRDLKFYVAYRKIRNFVCVVIQKGQLNLYLKLNPDTLTDEERLIAKDKRGVNHFGTGDVEAIIYDENDLLRALPLVERAYIENL